MKILVVTQYFYPEFFRINDLVLELKRRGHDISVLTGKPNYPQGVYYKGYSFKGSDDEIWNDIPIYRVPLRERKKGFLNLLRNYLSFVWNGSRRVKKIKDEYDVIYVFEVSPMTVALPAIKLKKKKKIPLVMNVQDLWPENIIAVTEIDNRVINFFLNKLVNYIYGKCDYIMCASPSFVDRIQKRVSDKSKVRYWPQYSLVEKSNYKNMSYDFNKINITFTGNIGEAQGIDLAIYAAEKLRNTNIHWHFVGEGRNKERLEELVNKLSLNESVTFHGYVDESEIPSYLASSDVALLILKQNPVFEMTIPAKLQTYLACGVPIIGCVSGEGKKIIIDAECGIIADSISIDSLVNCCYKLIDLKKQDLIRFGENACKYNQLMFNKIKLLDQLEYFLNTAKEKNDEQRNKSM